MCGGGDAVDEENLILCCACGCANIAAYPDCDCFGCSGKLGICNCNLECCLKPSAPCLSPFICLGCKPECDGCTVLNGQCQVCCAVLNCAIPCNEEVPFAISVLGATCCPKMGCCMKQKEIMQRE